MDGQVVRGDCPDCQMEMVKTAAAGAGAGAAVGLGVDLSLWILADIATCGLFTITGGVVGVLVGLSAAEQSSHCNC